VLLVGIGGSQLHPYPVRNIDVEELPQVRHPAPGASSSRQWSPKHRIPPGTNAITASNSASSTNARLLSPGLQQNSSASLKHSRPFAAQLALMRSSRARRSG